VVQHDELTDHVGEGALEDLAGETPPAGPDDTTEIKRDPILDFPPATIEKKSTRPSWFMRAVCWVRHIRS
jgi:hypothetical protein